MRVISSGICAGIMAGGRHRRGKQQRRGGDSTERWTVVLHGGAVVERQRRDAERTAPVVCSGGGGAGEGQRRCAKDGTRVRRAQVRGYVRGICSFRVQLTVRFYGHSRFG